MVGMAIGRRAFSFDGYMNERGEYPTEGLIYENIPLVHCSMNKISINQPLFGQFIPQVSNSSSCLQ